jgi:hypothetical protein
MLTNASGTQSSTQTQTSNPGLMGTLGQGLGLASMFVPGGGLASMFMRGAMPTLGNEVVNGMTRDGFRVG